MWQINGRIEELCMEIEVFLEIEGNTSQLVSKCIFSDPYQIEAFSRNLEVNTCLLFYIE